MRQAGLSYNHGLDQNVIDILSQLFVRLAHALQSVNEAFKAALVRPVVVQVIVRVSCCILDEVVIVFVDSVVREMHEKVVDVGISGLHIWLSCQPHKSIFEKKNAQRIYSVDEHV